MTATRRLRDVLAQHREAWDHADTRPTARTEFAKVVACGTDALGAEVFASADAERVVSHSCKSRACPSCGYRATRAWQRDLWRDLPDVPYAHVCVTMPDVLWPLFERNRHLLHDLPALGAAVLKQLARRTHGGQPIIAVIPHTFGRHLNFNCHLHILVSEGGLTVDGSSWREGARLDRRALMRLWRWAVITLLRAAARAGILDAGMTRDELSKLLTTQYERWWNVNVQRFCDKGHFLRYAGRYARRPPLAQHRLRAVTADEVRVATKDTRTKQTMETGYPPKEFFRRLAAHVPDRYSHNVRYFGLLGPRVKNRALKVLFALLGQERRGKSARLRWATSLQKSFGIDPLVDAQGNPMRWTRRLPPTLASHP